MKRISCLIKLTDVTQSSNCFFCFFLTKKQISVRIISIIFCLQHYHRRFAQQIFNINSNSNYTCVCSLLMGKTGLIYISLDNFLRKLGDWNTLLVNLYFREGDKKVQIF